MIVLKGGHIIGPKNIGQHDVLVAGQKIVKIEKDIGQFDFDVDLLDCKNYYIVPGFIDSHVHILGGGGEGSFKTRTPEIMLSDITSAGVTTVVGCIGTDGTTRHMSSLLAKAYALEEEGITAYVYTGSYEIPLQTLTGDIRKDIILIEKVIGVGEVAISDHRSSAPTRNELAKLASSARVAGMLSGKAGVVNVHLGDSKSMLDPLYDLQRNTDIPLTQFIPTHMNRNGDLFKEGLTYAKAGGHIDYTTSTTKQFIEMGEVPSAKALKLALDAEVPIDRITFTSDGQGSLPAFDDSNNLIGLTIGKLQSLYDSVKSAVLDEGIAFEEAIKVITSNPAEKLKLHHKGRVVVDSDADLCVIDKESLELVHVIAKGKLMVKDKEVLIKGTFE